MRRFAIWSWFDRASVSGMLLLGKVSHEQSDASYNETVDHWTMILAIVVLFAAGGLIGSLMLRHKKLARTGDLKEGERNGE